MNLRVSVDISLPNVINLISQMDLNEIEQVKNKIIERELYFKKFKKDDIDNIINDFKKENYSDKFLNDLKDGLLKSSVYHNEN